MGSQVRAFSLPNAAMTMKKAEALLYLTCMNVYVLFSYVFVGEAIKWYASKDFPQSIFRPVSPFLKYINIAIAIVLAVVSESYIKRIHVVMGASVLTFFGILCFLVNSIIGYNFFHELGRLLTVLNVPLYALILAMVLNQATNFKQFISEENFLFLAVFIIFMTFVLYKFVFLPFEVLNTISAFAISAGLQALQVIIFTFSYDRFASNLLYFNMHFLLLKYLVLKLFRIRKTETSLMVRLTVTRSRAAIVFLLPLFGFGFCQKAIRVTWKQQAKHTYTTTSLLEFSFMDFSNFFSVVTLPFLFFLIVPVVRRHFSNDFAKIYICFIFGTLSILSLCLTQYFLGERVDVLPNKNHEQVRILNALDTPTVLISNYFNYTVNPEDVATITWRVKENTLRFMDFHNEENGVHERTSLSGVEEKSVTYVITKRGVVRWGVDAVPPRDNSTHLSNPIVYVINFATLLILTHQDNYYFKPSRKILSEQIPIGQYKINVVNPITRKVDLMGEQQFNRGSVYGIYVYRFNRTVNIKVFNIVEEVTFNRAWILPTCLFYGAGNALVLLYVLKFTYLQFPPFLAGTFILIVLITLDISIDVFNLFYEAYEFVMLSTYGVFRMSLPWVLTVLVIHALNFFVFTLLATKYEFFNFVDFVRRELLLTQENEEIVNEPKPNENERKTNVK